MLKDETSDAQLWSSCDDGPGPSFPWRLVAAGLVAVLLLGAPPAGAVCHGACSPAQETLEHVVGGVVGLAVAVLAVIVWAFRGQRR